MGQSTGQQNRVQNRINMSISTFCHHCHFFVQFSHNRDGLPNNIAYTQEYIHNHNRAFKHYLLIFNVSRTLQNIEDILIFWEIKTAKTSVNIRVSTCIIVFFAIPKDGRNAKTCRVIIFR
jgi:hypothetical protein